MAGRILCGTGPADWAALETAASAWPGTVPAFGVHPWFAADAEAHPEWPDHLERHCLRRPDAWVGEVGLDGMRTTYAFPDLQERVFVAQLRLADRLNRPVNLHCVKAWAALVRCLDAHYLGNGPRDFIVHSFSGPHQFVPELAKRGAYFTIGPLASLHDSPRQRARAALLPLDRLLLESDMELSPGRDMPGYVAFSLDWLAAARDCRPETLLEHIRDNQRRLFRHDQAG